MNYCIHKKFLEKVAGRVSKILKFKLPELSIVLVDDVKIKELNRKYRKVDRVTDVLAFDYGLPFGGQGEIIICLPQAKRQAEELKHALKKELAILLIHGILHLVGYNDETEEQRNKMFKKEEEIWQKIKL